MTLSKNKFLAGALLTGLMVASGGAFAHNTQLDADVATAFHQCQALSASCAAEARSAYGILVFPTVTKADFIVGGSGGHGALIENEHITGYYNIGAASIGLQAGAEQASQIYVFRTPQALATLKASKDWHAGSDAGATLITDDANEKAVTGPVLAYVFDAEGLHGGIAVEAFHIWKTSNKPHNIAVK
jgi:lipid-binding SYLF domain-containing protein